LRDTTPPDMSNPSGLLVMSRLTELCFAIWIIYWREIMFA